MNVSYTDNIDYIDYYSEEVLDQDQDGSTLLGHYILAGFMDTKTNTSDELNNIVASIPADDKESLTEALRYYELGSEVYAILTNAQKEVFILNYKNNLQAVEIARQLGCSKANVSKLLKNIKTRLRKLGEKANG